MKEEGGAVEEIEGRRAMERKGKREGEKGRGGEWEKGRGGAGVLHSVHCPNQSESGSEEDHKNSSFSGTKHQQI